MRGRMGGFRRFPRRRFPRRRFSLFWWPRMFMMGSFMFLLFGGMAYKLRQDDVRIIERDTGKRAQDMTEDELVAAMRRLGISRLELTPEERDEISRRE